MPYLCLKQYETILFKISNEFPLKVLMVSLGKIRICCDIIKYCCSCLRRSCPKVSPLQSICAIIMDIQFRRPHSQKLTLDIDGSDISWHRANTSIEFHYGCLSHIPAAEIAMINSEILTNHLNLNSLIRPTPILPFQTSHDCMRYRYKAYPSFLNGPTYNLGI